MKRPGPGVTGLLLFAVALTVRWLYVHAGPDLDGPHSVAYKGDAWLWVRYAGALLRGAPFELGLPLRPPGNAYLLSWLWDGTPDGIALPKLVWLAMGAAVAPLVYWGARRPFGEAVALVAAGAAAFSTSLLELSSALNNETPYLLLALVALWLHSRCAHRPRLRDAALASLVSGLACLFRVEHALFFGASLLLLDRRIAPEYGRLKSSLALAAGVFVLAGWQLAAMERTSAFNRSTNLSPQASAALDAIEARTGVLLWTPEAQEQKDALPAFARRSASAFVAATVLHRGGSRVSGEDFDILEEAFGYRPEPLQRRRFVALYGPLNFALANRIESHGGFDRAPLQDPPPLEGGRERYPAELLAGLPPSELALEYPPHLKLLNEGYGAGWEVIRSDPLGWSGLAGRKLRRFAAGFGNGFGGFGLPVGTPDVRWAVDLAVPSSKVAGAWTVLLAVAALVGAVRLCPRLSAWPWFAFALAHVAVSIGFFGYARQGALVAPVVFVCAAAGLQPLASRLRGATALRAGLGLAVLLLGLEAYRAVRGVEVSMDGTAVTNLEPAPPEVHGERALTWSVGTKERAAR